MEVVMSRIPAAPRSGLLIKLVDAYARRRFGAVPEPVAVGAHHRRLMLAGGIHEMAVEKAATVLPAKLRELAVYQVAVRVGCSWCVDFGTMLQRHHGLDIERLQHIHDYARSPLYTELERLALDYALAMTSTPLSVTDEQVAELDSRLGHAGLLELTYVIALENMRARNNHALGITDQGFTSGDACRVPQRLVPQR